jgi:hypothetical protein
MHKTNMPGARAIDPPQRADVSIRSDGESADQLASASPPIRFGIL